MMKLCFQPAGRRTRKHAFTLLEVLLAVAIMTFIVVTMLLMFDLVQKSFRAGTQQAGVFEPGKATMELIAADLEQTDLNPDGVMHLYIRTNALMRPWAWPDLPAETNFFHDGYAMRLFGNKWIGTAYRLIPEGPSLGNEQANIFVGTLYTRSFTNSNAAQVENDAITFLKADITPAFKETLDIVADGVVNFSLVPLNKDGLEFATKKEEFASAKESPFSWQFYYQDPPSDRAVLRTNALPTYLEFKVAFLEPSVTAQIKTMPNREFLESYLKGRPHRVHIFKRRIPILTADRVP